MSKGSTTRTQTAFSGPPADVPDVSAEWAHRPLQKRPLAALILASCILAVAAWVAIVTGKLHLAVLAGGGAAVVMWRNYLPVAYHVNPEGLRHSVFRWSRIVPWTEVAEVHFGQNALQIVRRGKGEAASDHKTILVPWGPNKHEVRSCLKQLVPNLIRNESNTTSFELSPNASK